MYREPARHFLDYPDCMREFEGLPANNLDLSLTIALPMMWLWREDLGPTEPIHLLHDASNEVSKQLRWRDYLTTRECEAFRLASGSIQFPIGIDRTEFVTSEDWAGIQLTDVIAGAFNKACQWNWAQRP